MTVAFVTGVVMPFTVPIRVFMLGAVIVVPSRRRMPMSDMAGKVGVMFSVRVDVTTKHDVLTAIHMMRAASQDGMY